MKLARRKFLTLAAAAACGRRRGTASEATAYVANQTGQTIAAVSLRTFSVTRQLPLGAEPSVVLPHPSKPILYALAPAKGMVFEIDADALVIQRSVRVGASASALRVAPDGESLWASCRETRSLVRIPADTLKTGSSVRLPSPPEDFDFQPSGDLIAVGLAGGGVALVNRRSLATERTIAVGDPRTVRFRSDGRYVLVGNRTGRILTVADAASGKLVVHLPLPIEPETFCFKADGGELFITGRGMDAVVVAYPYQTEIKETVLAGKGPRSMAASTSPEYLLVSNAEAGDVTILEIETNRVLGVVAVGSETGEIAITPDSQYALVLSRGAGQLAVIRVAAVVASRSKTAPLFTVIPVGAGPVSVAVRRT